MMMMMNVTEQNARPNQLLHSYGTWQVCVCRRRPSCLEQSPWPYSERANTWQI